MIHITTINKLPDEWNWHYSRELSAIFDGFMKQEIKFGRVEHWRSSYKSLISARTNLHNAIKRRGLPIKVRKIREELYFVRTDM